MDLMNDLQNWCIVCRTFTAAGKILQAEDIVNTVGWKTVEQLIEDRYLRKPNTSEEIARVEAKIKAINKKAKTSEAEPEKEAEPEEVAS